MNLLDALGIKKAVVAGHDWGAGAAYVLAALFPERVERLITMSSPYMVEVTPGSELDYTQQRFYWYQWFLGNERGREALQDNRREFCRFLWQTWSPTWKFTEAEFKATAPSWDNPDFADVALHFYRVRWGNASKDPHYAKLDAKLEKNPEIAVSEALSSRCAPATFSMFCPWACESATAAVTRATEPAPMKVLRLIVSFGREGNAAASECSWLLIKICR